VLAERGDDVGLLDASLNSLKNSRTPDVLRFRGKCLVRQYFSR
jgi:hypothetical protein